MAASSRLSQQGKTDLLIRDANSNRFQFLINIDNGNFRPASSTSGGFFNGAGNFDSLLVGPVASRGSVELDDVVTFDQDMTLKVFINNGLQSFDPQPPVRPNPNFQGAQAPYVAADFGNGRLGLAALVVRGTDIGITLLQADDAGVFSVETGAVPLTSVPNVRLNGSNTTEIVQSSLALFDTVAVQIRQAMAGQFRSALHGNSKSDLGFIFSATEDSRVAGMCSSDPRTLPPTPPPHHLPRPMVCQELDPFQDCPPSKRPCFTGDCCFCKTGPPHGQCPTTCSIPEGPLVPSDPFVAFCRSTQPFALALTVFGNTCGD